MSSVWESTRLSYFVWVGEGLPNHNILPDPRCASLLRILTGKSLGEKKEEALSRIEVKVAHRRAQYDESCRLCSGGSSWTCTTFHDMILFPKRYVDDPEREDHQREAPFFKACGMLIRRKTNKEACIRRLLTLWRMSAVRVRLPPAVFCGC